MPRPRQAVPTATNTQQAGGRAGGEGDGVSRQRGEHNQLCTLVWLPADVLAVCGLIRAAFTATPSDWLHTRAQLSLRRAASHYSKRESEGPAHIRAQASKG